ncbi:MAG: hypothetical protein WA156_16070 [Methylocystis silviterrae]
MRANLITFFSGLCIVVVATFASIIGAEFCLRVTNIPPEPQFGWKWSSSPYKSDANIRDVRVNDLGLRGRPIAYDEHDFVIVLVGDSYIEAGAQPYADMPEQILENLLTNKYGFKRVRVFSVASAGWGQDQELLSLGAYFSRFRADLVLMWLTPINDYWENGNVDRNVHSGAGPLKPTFQLINHSELRLEYPQKFQFKIRLLLEKTIASLRGGAGGLEQFYVQQWLDKLPPSNITPAPPAFCPSTDVDQLDVVASFQRGGGRVTAVTTEDLDHARSHFSHFLVPISMRERYQINITHRLIEETTKLAVAHGATFRAFYPRGSDIDRALSLVKCVKDQTGNYYLTDFSDLVFDLRESNLKEMLLDIDITSRTPNCISSRDWHLNRDGNVMAMDALAQQLLANGLLQQGMASKPSHDP